MKDAPRKHAGRQLCSRVTILWKPDPSLALRHLLSPEQNACESNGVQYHKQNSKDLKDTVCINPGGSGVYAYDDWAWFWTRGPNSDVNPHRGNTPDDITSCHNYNQTNEVCGEHNGKTDPLVVSVMFRFAWLPSQTQGDTGKTLVQV